MKIILTWLTLLLGAVLLSQEKKTEPKLDNSQILVTSAPGHKIMAYTEEDFARDRGYVLVSRSDAEEICRALVDSIAAHDAALNFYRASLVAFGPTATKQERETMEANLKQCIDGSKRTLALLEKWKERGAKLSK